MENLEAEKTKLFEELKDVREYIKKLERAIDDVELIENLEKQNSYTSEKIQRCKDEQEIIFVRQRMKKLGAWLKYNFDEDAPKPAEELPKGKYY